MAKSLIAGLAGAVALATLGLISASVVPGSPAGASGRSPGPLAPAEGVLFGAHVQTPAGTSPYEAVTNLEAQLGRRLAIDHYYRPWGDPFPDDREGHDISAGRIPMISWGKVSTAEINSGAHDERIRGHARGVRELSQPVLLRWFWEMGGNRNLETAGQPEDYIAAWRRLHGIFAEEGAGNAAWVWCPDASDFVDGRAQSFYPGDDAVDWTCADGYNYRHPAKRSTQPRSFEDTFAAFYAWASERPKPIMVGEYGAVEDGPGDKAAWVNTARETLKTRFPEMAAVVYFHSLRERDGLIYDWRMDSSPDSIAAFSAMGADPWFNPAVVVTLPDTSIDSGPEGVVASATATFTFTASEAGGGFQCRLDSAGFEACSSPHTYTGLPDGPHAFEVRASSADGRPDPTQARREWTIDATPPAVVTVAPPEGSSEAGMDTSVTATFSEDVEPSTVTAASFVLLNETTGMETAGTVTYNPSTRTATLRPRTTLVPANTYRATVKAGIKDPIGNAMSADHVWRFTIGAAPPLLGLLRGLRL